VEAGQPAQLTGTNRSIGFSAASSGKDHETKRAANPPPQRHPHNSLRTAACPKVPAGTSAGPRPARAPADQGMPSREPANLELAHLKLAHAAARRRFGRPGGHSEGQNTRSHPELGRENPQRQWYCVLRRGRVGRRQARQTARHSPQTPPNNSTPAGWSSPVARQAHNLKVAGSNPAPATKSI
jgi:hypothetical protein